MYDFSNPRPPFSGGFLFDQKGKIMQKILIFFILCICVVNDSYAERVPAKCVSPCMVGVTVPNYYYEQCKSCLATPVQDSTTGVKINNNSSYSWNCPADSGASASGSCRSVITYTCLPGWYGSAINSSSGCTKCPENATCRGGNSSMFICDAGYYTNGTRCIKCATATGNSVATSAAGALGITDCYLPSGTTVSDNNGIFNFTANCPYSL